MALNSVVVEAGLRDEAVVVVVGVVAVDLGIHGEAAEDATDWSGPLVLFMEHVYYTREYGSVRWGGCTIGYLYKMTT